MRSFVICLMLVLGAAVIKDVHAGQIIVWPGYVDNSDCLADANKKECGYGVNVFSADGKFYDDATVFQKDFDKLWTDTFNAQDPKISINLRFSGLIPDSRYDPGFGIHLTDANGNPTNYKLKGLASGVNVRIHWCTRDNDNNPNKCSAIPGNGYTDYTFSENDIYEGKTWIETSLTHYRQRPSYIEVWMNGKNFRLYTANPEADSRVRSIKLPGISIHAHIQAINKAEPGKGHQTIATPQQLVLFSKNTLLNQRKCKLTFKPSNSVFFGDLTVTPKQIGNIADIKYTELYLNCGQTDPNWVIDGKQVWGSYAVHTVESVKVIPILKVAGKPNVIGLKRTEDQDARPNLYVEGSFTNSVACGHDVLPLDTNLKAYFPSEFKREDKLDWKEPSRDPEPQTIRNRYMNKLYWRLCKETGAVDPGEYKGSATVTIQYK